MEILRRTADKYGLVCLMHEKPFAGINGSGKHNNWSMSTDVGEICSTRVTIRHDNAQFLVFCVAVVRAVAKYSEILRLSIASANNDHRLGRKRSPAGDHLCVPGRSAAGHFRAAGKGVSQEQQTGWDVYHRCFGAAAHPQGRLAIATEPARSRSPGTSLNSARSGPVQTSARPIRCSTRSWPSHWTLSRQSWKLM